MDNFMKLNDLCMTIQSVGQEISPKYHLVILLVIITREYDPIVKIIANMPIMTLFHAKEMMRREYDGMTITVLKKRVTCKIGVRQRWLYHRDAGTRSIATCDLMLKTQCLRVMT